MLSAVGTFVSWVIFADERSLGNGRLYLREVVRWLACLSAIVGLSLEEVAIQNLLKLESRKERGVLKGDGDKR